MLSDLETRGKLEEWAIDTDTGDGNPVTKLLRDSVLSLNLSAPHIPCL